MTEMPACVSSAFQPQIRVLRSYMCHLSAVLLSVFGIPCHLTNVCIVRYLSKELFPIAKS